MAILTPVRHRFYNNDGTVANGGKVYVYEPNSTTPKDTYTSAAATSLNTWPIILDSKGECDMWTSGLFKINVLQSDDVQITGYPVDNCGASPSASLDATQVTVTPVGGIAATDVQSALAELDSEKATIVAMNLKADVGGNASQVFDVSNGLAGTDAINFSQAFGLGQTWIDVTASRAASTTYTNSTGKAIAVSLNVISTSGANSNYVVDTTQSGVTTRELIYAATGPGYYHTTKIIVPAGESYSFALLNCSVNKWMELR